MEESRKRTRNHAALHVIFCMEIASQCAMAELAGAQLNEALKNGAPETPIWAAIQSILIAAASISKVFWGSGATAEQIEKRASLRELAEVTDQSPLRSRHVRNSFEHFDERIEG